MDYYKVPIDFQLVTQVYGEDTVSALMELGVTHILDWNSFIMGKRRVPDIGSIFLYGDGGSYDFDHPEFGEIDIRNGTLLDFKNLDDGSEYYYEYFGTPMVDVKEIYVPGTYSQINIIFTNPKYQNILMSINYQDAVDRIESGKISEAHPISESDMIVIKGERFLNGNQIVYLKGPVDWIVLAQYDPTTNQIHPPLKS